MTAVSPAGFARGCSKLSESRLHCAGQFSRHSYAQLRRRDAPRGTTLRSRTVTKATLSRGPPTRRRLARYLLSLPKQVDKYFEGRPLRRWTWRVTSFGAGFFCTNMVALTFGTLAVNDVVAAFVTFFFYEFVSRTYWSAPKGSFKLELLNWFKNGVMGAVIAETIKLSG